MKQLSQTLRSRRLQLLALAAVFSSQVKSQVSAYTFTQTTGTYAPITGTDLFGTTWNDNVSSPLALGFNFQFNAVTYSSVTVSSNGFVTFGATAPGSGNYVPISNTGTYAGAISAFGKDLSANTGATGVSYTMTGSTPNRKFIVQWENAKRIGGDVVNFQIVLNETSNQVDMIYGTCSATSTANTNKVQVGLRGATSADFNNRSAGNNVAWTSSSAGTTNADNVNFKSTVLPGSGLTFSWMAPSCFPVSNVSVVGMTPATASFTWASTSGTSFDLYYGPSPLTAPNGTTVPTATASATSYTASGLSSGTGYALYVRNNCGAGNTSSWSTLQTFTTPCTATTVPYVQDFESVTTPALPVCTSAENLGSGNIWNTTSPAASGFTSKTLTYKYNGTYAANTWFYTQGINLTAGTSYRLSYRYGCGDAGYPERMRVNYGTSPISSAMTTTLSIHTNIINDAVPLVQTVDFVAPSTGVFYIGFQAYSLTDQYYLYVDDITVNLTPSCLEPTAAAISAVTATTAVATWTTAGTATAWDLFYGPTPLAVPNATTVPTATASANTYTLSGLSPSTGYDFYVRSHCSPTDQSNWTGPKSFFTPCLPPAITSTTPGLRCGVGTTTLGATVASGGTLNWYTAASGGTAVATGSVYTTPSISSTTNYYVSSTGAPYISAGGLLSPVPTSTASYAPYGEGIMFNAAQTFTLVSADVYPNGPADDLYVDLYDNNYNLLGSYTGSMPAGTGTTPFTVPLNIVVPAGTDYHFEVYTDIGTPLIANTGVGYPLPIGSVGSVTAGFDGSDPISGYYLYLYNLKVSSICESPRVAVTASVTTPPALTVTSGTTVCANAIASFSVTSTVSDFDSYVWTPAANLYTNPAATTPYAGGSATTLYFKSATNGPQTYTLTANNSTSQCSNVVNTTMTVDIPQITASATPTLLCSGSSATLSASQIGAGVVMLGAGTLTTTSSDLSAGNSVSPYSHYYGGYKSQYILTAAELSAAGLFQGNITSLGFNVTTAGTSYTDFSIKMGATALTAMSTSFVSPLTPVYGLNTVTPVVGINTYNFSTPFNWNGSSNILVEVTWSNNNSGGTAAEVTYDPTSYAALAYYRDDDQLPAVIAAVTTPENTRNFRPQLFIGGQSPVAGAGSYTWQWNPGAVNSNTTTVSPTSTISTGMSYTVSVTNPATTCTNSAVVSLTVNPVPTVTVAASTSSLCSGNSATLTAGGATTYSWMPAGGTASVATVSPSSSTVYTVTGTSAGCSDTKTVSLSVSPSPTVTASASPSVICAGATVSLTANGATTYSWMPGSSSSASVNVTPSATTVYTVNGTSAGCTTTRTVNVTVNDVPTLTVTSNPASGVLCTAGATATLTAAGTSTAYAWTNGPSTASSVVSPTATTVYTVTGTNSCGTKTMTTTVTVATTPTIAASSSTSLICVGSSVVLTASATPGVTYAWSPVSSSAPSITVSPSGTLTYTVTGTNACGTATASVVLSVSPCTGIETIDGGIAISIYPNPAHDLVSIEIPASLSSEQTVVEVTDALGKLVMKEQLSRELTTLKVSQLEEGVYFFRVIANKQTVKTGKVVKH